MCILITKQTNIFYKGGVLGFWGLKAFVGIEGEWSFSSEEKIDDKNMTLTFSRSDTKKKAAATGGKKAKAAKASKPAPTKATAAGTKRTRGGK